MDDLEIKIILPPDPLTDAKFVRREVFQKEQNIDKHLDFDGNDASAVHIIVYKQQKPIGTGRIRTLQEGNVKIERVAVLSEFRGKGIGKKIMEHIDKYVSEMGIKEAVLDAQLHAKEFYERLGYTKRGDVFEEVGIPHIVMVKKFI